MQNMGVGGGFNDFVLIISRREIYEAVFKINKIRLVEKMDGGSQMNVFKYLLQF